MTGSLARLVPLFGARAGLVAACVAGLTAGTLLMLVGPLLVAHAVDVDLAAGDSAGLLRTALAYLAVLVGTTGLTYASRIGVEVAAQDAMVALKRQLFDHLVHHDLAFHDRHPSGRLITRVQGDTDALRVLFTEVILPLPADVALFLGMFAVLAVRAPMLVPVVFAVIPPYVALFILFRRVARRRFVAVRQIRAELTGFLAEHVRGMPMLRRFGRQGWALGRSEELNARVFRAEAIEGLHPVWYFNAVFLVRNLGVVAVLGIGALYVERGEIGVGVLLMGLGYLRQMFHPLMRLSNQLSTLERARAAADRVAEILDAKRTILDPAQPAPWPGLRRALRLEDVAFHYTSGMPVLRGLSLEVPAGTHVGIVGATGGGKSTVLNLLMRFRDPVSGRVTVDGVDLRDLRVADVRDRFGLVLQDVHLFPGTVLENLGGEEAAARRALEVVGVDLALDHVLSEGGGNLSRGERQLVTFARALVRDPEILVLDEATSAIDPATESAVQAALRRVQSGRTTVTVAHRLKTVRDCDRIYVLAAGEVREAGTHDELLARDGLYAALYKLQEAA